MERIEPATEVLFVVSFCLKQLTTFYTVATLILGPLYTQTMLIVFSWVEAVMPWI